MKKKTIYLLMIVAFSMVYAPNDDIDRIDPVSSDLPSDDEQRGRRVIVDQPFSHQGLSPEQHVQGQITDGSRSVIGGKPLSDSVLPVVKVTQSTADTVAHLVADTTVIADRNRTSSLQTSSDPVVQAQLHAVLKLINTFTESISKNDLKASYIPYAIRVLELMGDFEDEVTQQGINDIDTQHSFAQTKLFLKLGIVNQQIQVTTKVLTDYGIYESDNNQDSGFSLAFKTQVESLFAGRTPEVLDPVLQPYFTFKSDILHLLDEGNRSAFFARVTEELKTSIAQQRILQNNIMSLRSASSGDVALDASFSSLYSALHTQDVQLDQQAQAALVTDTPVQKQSLDLVSLLLEIGPRFGKSLIPNADFESMVKGIEGRVQNLQKYSQQVAVIGELFSQAVADFQGSSSEKIVTQFAMQGVAFKVALDQMQNLYDTLDSDRKTILQVIANAEGKIISSDLVQQLSDLKQLYEQLLVPLKQQLDSYRKNLLSPQAQNFARLTHNILETLSGNDLMLTQVTLARFEAFSLRDFSLDDALAVTQQPELLSDLKKMQVFEQSFSKALRDFSVSEKDMQTILQQIVSKDGVWHNVVETFFQKLQDPVYGKNTQLMAQGYKDSFDAAVKTIALYSDSFNVSLDQDVDTLVGQLKTSISSKTYTDQNALYNALCEVAKARQGLWDIITGLPRTTTPAGTQLVTGMKEFLALLGKKAPAQLQLKEGVLTDNDVVDQVKLLLTADFASTYGSEVEAATSKPVYQQLLIQIALHDLDITPKCQIGDYYVLTDLQAVRFKKLLDKNYTITHVRDWRYIPKRLLEALGSDWLSAAQGFEKVAPPLSFAEQKILCQSWAAALRDVGLGDKPFRDMSANLFSSPFARDHYLENESFPAGYTDVSIDEQIKYALLQKYIFKTDLIQTYEGCVTSGAGQGRSIIRSFETIIARVSEPSFTDCDNKTLIELLNDTNSLTRAIQVGQSQDASIQTSVLLLQGISDALSRLASARQLVIASTSSKQPSFEEQLQSFSQTILADLNSRTARIQTLLTQIQDGHVPTLSELQQLYVARITLGIDQQVYGTLLFNDHGMPTSSIITTLQETLEALPIPNPELYQKLVPLPKQVTASSAALVAKPSVQPVEQKKPSVLQRIMNRFSRAK